MAIFCVKLISLFRREISCGCRVVYAAEINCGFRIIDGGERIDRRIHQQSSKFITKRQLST